MKTLKLNIIIMEAGDRLEVRSGDITTHITGGDDKGSSVRVTRPPTDGRFIRVICGALDSEGNPHTREEVANGYVDLEAVDH